MKVEDDVVECEGTDGTEAVEVKTEITEMILR